MGTIKLLDKLTTNQIAAGEVVERPVSVIKELVENAIDAKSDWIEVKVAGGGLKEITVIDNGEGMSKDELPLALARHATSKIETAADLHKLTTLGFRGEALPSITSVSKLHIVTRREADVEGTSLKAEGGQVTEVIETGAPAGTYVKVRELFYNTPARLKFMKSFSRETVRIHDLMYRLALAYPAIAFSLTVDGRKVFTTTGNGDLLGVIGEIYGLNGTDSFFSFEHQDDLLLAKGFLAKPGFNRSNKYHQTFFVNQRYIINNMLSRAIHEAYHTLLPKGRHPVCVISLNMNPELIDVNVHPTKIQVRFTQEEDVFKALRDSVKKALQDQDISSTFSFPMTYNTKVPNRINRTQDKPPVYFQKQVKDESKEYSLFSDKPLRPEYVPVENTVGDRGKPRRLIGQFSSTYIVYEDEDNNMVLIDQHAAHERILYDRFKKAGESGAHKLQQVIPCVIEIDRDLEEVLREHLHDFQELGFHLEEFGSNSFLLRTIPLFIKDIYSGRLVKEMVEEILRRDTSRSETDVKDDIYKVLACKAAIKANEKLQAGEMEKIIAGLEGSSASTCPHGRPAILVIPKSELAKKFLRSS